MNNPFVLTFGKKPTQFISRPKDIQKIVDSFSAEIPSEQVFIITGVRGSGKTATLSVISKHFIEENDWIVIDLNSEKDLLEGFASELYQNSKVKMLFAKKEFSFSFKGISFSIEGTTPVLTVETLIKTMLEKIQKKGKKVLITIDEISNNEYMRIFTKTFQSLIRYDFPVFLLMTGIYENISKLQDEKSLTFLYRAPKIYLESLNIYSIAYSYKKIFEITDDESIKLAHLTNGYAYAFQILGYLFFESGQVLSEDLLVNYDHYLQDFVYNELWNKLSKVEQNILLQMPNEPITTKDLITKLNLTNSYFSNYRERLIKKGLIYSPSYGSLSLTLPRFFEFLKIKDI